MSSKTVISDLRKIIDKVEPSTNPTEGFNTIADYCNSVNMLEVYSNIYIGNKAAAKDIDNLNSNSILNVLNCAHGEAFDSVDTNEDYYKNSNVKYCGLQMSDSVDVNAKKHFEKGADFIENALENNEKVLVHCFAGLSRSATIICAFLMLKKNMNAIDALTFLRKQRPIIPNEGFLAQLADLDNQLKQ